MSLSGGPCIAPSSVLSVMVLRFDLRCSWLVYFLFNFFFDCQHVGTDMDGDVLGFCFHVSGLLSYAHCHAIGFVWFHDGLAGASAIAMSMVSCSVVRVLFHFISAIFVSDFLFIFERFNVIFEWFHWCCLFPSQYFRMLLHDSVVHVIFVRVHLFLLSSQMFSHLFISFATHNWIACHGALEFDDVSSS